MRAVLLAFTILVLAGCEAAPPTIAVSVDTPTRRGRGVIIGPRTVLTVCHVVSGCDEVMVEDKRARVVQRHLRGTETGDDGIAVLELEEGEFPPSRIGQIAERVGAGVTYLPARGECAWPWGLQPGDSGSPILDAHGRVTGLVRAVYGRAEALDKTIVIVSHGDS
ncbi:MAG TPA: hypothetical protein VFF73_31600 [Planctomycetota bacterium]|nr:hypothetical protein [Planctomycetota bacterium]